MYRRTCICILVYNIMILGRRDGPLHHRRDGLAQDVNYGSVAVFSDLCPRLAPICLLCSSLLPPVPCLASSLVSCLASSPVSGLASSPLSPVPSIPFLPSLPRPAPRPTRGCCRRCPRQQARRSSRRAPLEAAAAASAGQPAGRAEAPARTRAETPTRPDLPSHPDVCVRGSTGRAYVQCAPGEA